MIAVSSEGNSPASMVAPRFARAPFFLLFDEQGKMIEAMPNDTSDVAHGAGGRAVQLLSGKKVTSVVGPMFGPNAVVALKAAGIKAFEARDITVEEAVKKVMAGEMKEMVF
jgi:predicted Fe-Mo cluster-binding NifX family protein